MSDTKRWTVRGVDPEALALLLLVQRGCGQTLGALLSDAIREWYNRLPVIDCDIADEKL
jgi:hypothetical protein